jgi:hypothetical protein
MVMLRSWNLIVLVLLIGGLSSIASAQPQPPRPPGRPGPDHGPAPRGPVVARVNVNVETEVDFADDSVAAGSDSAKQEDDDDEHDETKGESKSDIGELLETTLRHAGPWSVIADINVNVETSIKVRVHSSKAVGSRGPEVMAPKPAAVQSEDKTEKPAPATEPPRKKRRKKGAKKPPQTSLETKPEQPQTRIELNRLKIGDTLELGVTGELESEQRANQIAQRINVGRSQTLLGTGFVGMMLPEQSESLKVVQKAISSVQATATGKELAVSVAFPKETPGAVKTLLKAALNK